MDKQYSGEVGKGPDGAAWQLGCQILEVRRLLVAQALRRARERDVAAQASSTGPGAGVAGAAGPAAHLWADLQRAAAENDATAVAHSDWALREALYQQLDGGMTLALLKQGNSQLLQACQRLPPATDIAARLSAAAQFLQALNAADFEQASAAAAFQLECDERDLKSLFCS